MSLESKPITSHPYVTVLPVQGGQLRHQMGWIEAHDEEACLKVTSLVSTRHKTPYPLILEQKVRQSSAIITHQEFDAQDHGNLFLLRTYPRHHALPFPQPSQSNVFPVFK